MSEDGRPTTLVSRDKVRLPKDRRAVAVDVMTLAGEALMNKDRFVWSILYRASKEIEHG